MNGKTLRKKLLLQRIGDIQEMFAAEEENIEYTIVDDGDKRRSYFY